MKNGKTNSVPVVPVTNRYNNETINIEPILKVVSDYANNFEEFGQRIDGIIRSLVINPDIKAKHQDLADALFYMYEIRDAFMSVSPIEEGGSNG